MQPYRIASYRVGCKSWCASVSILQHADSDDTALASHRIHGESARTACVFRLMCVLELTMTIAAESGRVKNRLYPRHSVCNAAAQPLVGQHHVSPWLGGLDRHGV